MIHWAFHVVHNLLYGIAVLGFYAFVGTFLWTLWRAWRM